MGVPIEDKNIPDPNGVNLDKDDVEHMSWISNRAMERAQRFKIEGVNYNLTMQVVKNIIPAIASTNALISALCVNEALKVLTWASFGLNNYIMYMGQDGIYSRTFDYKKNPGTTFKLFYANLMNDNVLKLKGPSVSTDSDKALFMNSKALRSSYEENMGKCISDLMEDNAILRITDPKVLGKGIAKIKVIFEKG